MLQIGSFIYVQTILEPRKLDSNRTLQDLRKRQIELSMVPSQQGLILII